MFVPLLLLWHHHTFFHVGKEIPWRPDNKGLNFQGTVSVSPLDLFDTLFHQTRIHWVQINSQPSKEIFWKDCLWLALMKYTLENLHFNHIWSSAFQKWFCLTTSDLSLREVSFRRMPAFKSQVNRTQTNFPGGCNKPARHLTRSRLSSALHQVCLQGWEMLHVYTTSPIHNRAIKIHQNIITASCLLGKPWFRLSTWHWFTNIDPVSEPKSALPNAPGHSGSHRIVVPFLFLETAISWSYLKLSLAHVWKFMC